MAPSIRVAVQTLRANPVRSLLSTLGVVMGAASLVAVLSLGDGAEAFAREQIERRGVQIISLAPKTSDVVDGLAVPRSSYPLFDAGHASALAAAIMPGSAVILTVEGTGTFVMQPGGPNRAALVTAVSGSPVASGMNMAHGRFLSPDEMSRGTASMVVSHRMALELTGRGDPASVIGRTLLLQGQPWSIVGVLAAFPGERTFGVIVPFTAAGRAMVPSVIARPSTVLVRAPRVEDVATVRTQVETWADATDERWRRNNQIAISTTGLDRLQQINQGILLFKLLMGAFTAISLIVGGIGIMNVLLASVVERTREIGIRRAAGAKKRDIAVQFLAESVVISLAGAILGAVLGIGGAFLVTAIMRAQTAAQVHAAATFGTLIVGMAAAIVVGLTFGTYPALKAARLSPVDAMRYE